MRRLVTEGWTRTALSSCAVLLLVLAGAVAQGLTPRAAAARAGGAMLDSTRAADHGLRPGQSGQRVVLDRRQTDPGFDRAPAPDFAPTTRLVQVAAPDDVRAAWANTSVAPPSSPRVAHRPRGPPARVPPSFELWNGGAFLARGSHHA